MKGRRILIVFAVVVAVGGLLYWLAFVRPVHKRWTETVEVADGVSAVAQFDHSARPYYGFGHAGGFGGGSDHCRMSVDVAGKRYEWEGNNERPFVLRLQDAVLFMAAFDRTDMSRIRYRYYRSDADGRLCEISPTEFPKSLAVQNAWLHDDDIKLLRAMDPADYWFQRSLTARMWLHLDKGTDYADSASDSQSPSPEFLAEYKARHIARPLTPTTGAAP